MYGKLPWHSLFEPVIKLAEDGFKVSKKLGTVCPTKLSLQNHFMQI